MDFRWKRRKSVSNKIAEKDSELQNALLTENTGMGKLRDDPDSSRNFLFLSLLNQLFREALYLYRNPI